VEQAPKEEAEDDAIGSPTYGKMLDTLDYNGE
jgi:hypothetical protein